MCVSPPAVTQPARPAVLLAFVSLIGGWHPHDLQQITHYYFKWYNFWLHFCKYEGTACTIKPCFTSCTTCCPACICEFDRWLTSLWFTTNHTLLFQMIQLITFLQVWGNSLHHQTVHMYYTCYVMKLPLLTWHQQQHGPRISLHMRKLHSTLQLAVKVLSSWRRVQPNVSWNCLATACPVGTILFTPGL